MYDTTVYVDVLGDHFPRELQQKASSKQVWHCSVATAEISYACGRLNPAHPGTSIAVKKTKQVLNAIPTRRLLSPDNGIWLEAGVLSGTTDRLLGQPAGSTLNDALIFLTALKHGCTVLTRNIRDFDLLQQIIPEGRVLFYNRLP